MSKNKWSFLSYELSEDLSNYGGNPGIKIEWIRNMKNGDTSNNSALQLPSHTGTHIDYPFHFLENGKTGSAYPAQNFIFTKVACIDISAETTDDYLIHPAMLEQHTASLNKDLEFLIIKTGFCHHREEEKYWKYNWGFAPETAGFLRSLFPALKMTGFDLISLSAYQQREIGREAHKQFLGEQPIMIVEDMDLTTTGKDTVFIQLIVSPFRFKGADGAPVTIMAETI